MQSNNTNQVVNKFIHTSKPSVLVWHDWLYHHNQLLQKLSVITDKQAENELTHIAENQVEHNQFGKAMFTVCKIHNLYDWDFYDMNDYEPVSIPSIQKRILHIYNKKH